MNLLKIIQIIVSFFSNPSGFANKLLKGVFGKLMQKYVSADILTQYNKYKDVSKLINPTYIAKMIKRANQKEIKALNQEIKDLNKQRPQLKGVAEKYHDEMTRKIHSLDESSWKPVFLSSSWVKKGMFKQYKGSINGTLIIWVQSDKDKKHRIYGPYMYPNIGKDIWLAMQRATGKNGTGAGSVMWRMFLHEWLPSQMRAYIRRFKNQMSKKSFEANQKYLKSLTTRFLNSGKGNANVEKSRAIMAQVAQRAEKNKIKHDYYTQALAAREAIKAQNEAITSQIKGLKGTIEQKRTTIKSARGVIKAGQTATRAKQRIKNLFNPFSTAKSQSKKYAKKSFMSNHKTKFKKQTKNMKRR